MIGYLNRMRRKYRVEQLCVRMNKIRTAIGCGCIEQSSVGLGRLGEVIAGYRRMEKSIAGKGKSTLISFI